MRVAADQLVSNRTRHRCEVEGLVGAMNELGRAKPDESVFLESWITNSDKVFAVYRPPGGAAR